jgi:hypothetical protein
MPGWLSHRALETATAVSATAGIAAVTKRSGIRHLALILSFF